MNLSKETVVHFLSTVVSSAAGFVATLVIARLLGADALGVYSLVLATLFWMEIPTNGIRIALLKRLSEGTDREAYFTAGLAVNLLLFAVGGTLILLFRSQLNDYFRRDVVLLFLLLFGARVAYSTVSSGLQGQKRVALSGLLGTLERTLRTVIQVTLIVSSYAVSGLVVGHTISLLVAAVVGAWFLSFGLGRPRVDHFREIYDYGKYAAISNLQGKAYGWLDTLVLGFFVSTSLIGIYEVAWSITSFLVLLNKSIQSTLFPEISELNEQDDYDQIRTHLAEGLSFAGLILLPGFVGALAMGSEILKIYDSEFTAGTTVLLILIVARLGSSVGKIFVSTISALDRPDVAFRLDVVLAVVNLVANVALISTIGWVGAAIGTALTGVLNLGLGYVALRRFVGPIRLPATEIGRQLVASALMGGVVWGLARLAPPSHYTTVGVVFVGAGVYAAVLGGISPRFRLKLQYVIGSFT
jgi:O-antigen/teichoic acid export membrane protein